MSTVSPSLSGACLCGAVRIEILERPDRALEAPTGMKLSKHTFVGDKGDYYEIADGVRQSDSYCWLRVTGPRDHARRNA